MVDEQSDADRVPPFVLTERERFPNQVGTALTQGVVEPFNMCGFACLLADGPVPFGRDHAAIGGIEIRIADGPFAIVGWERSPQPPTGFGGPITDREPDHPARLALQGDPDPDLLPFVADKGPQFIDLEDRTLA